ncbi:4338_t:CDS:1 [Entrophospora sp. SA101]|nr:4338_t:CDS:1 [Entrophospora sp. SA101]
MARKRRNKHSKYTNEKHLELIGITAEILLVISCTISIYKKSDVIVTTILTTIAILLFFALLIYFVNKIKRLEKDLQKEKNEIRKLRKKTCKICKIVYASMVDQSISFDENFDKYALPFPYYEGDDDSYMVDYNRIYRLDNYLFISFHDEDSEGKCYLINLIDGLIYLPIDNNG